MSDPIRFEAAPVAVRGDIPAAHRRFWSRLSEPGTWWTGAERVALAAETRAARGCALCRRRKSALSPNSVQGEHERAAGGALLPAPAIDAVHRIITDPARLSRGWLLSAQGAGLADGAYVELLGLCVAMRSIDVVCRGLGVPLHELPEPQPGEPTRRRPAAARMEAAWVPMLPASGARGEESDLWTGRTGNVIRAMSLVPDAVRDLSSLSAAHYLPNEKVSDPSAGRTLSRAQIELVAGRVSALAECFY